MENPVCFDNFIGVKCLTQNPISGLWINNLPGLNLKYAAAVATNQQTGLELLQEKIAFATSLVLSELYGYLLPYFRVNSVMDESKVGDFAGTFLAPVAAWRGLQVTVRRSRMLRIRVTGIQVRIQETATLVSLKIVDGTTVETFSGTTDTNGEVFIPMDYLSKTQTIQVLMDNTAINVDNTAVNAGCGCGSKNGEFLFSQGWNGVTTSSASYGLQVQMGAECDLSQLACALQPRLGLPILYRSGVEVVIEAGTTDRLNGLTLLDDKKLEILHGEFTSSYDKQMKILAASLPELLKRMDPHCIVCNQNQYVESAP